jgi:hypothetical protein
MPFNVIDLAKYIYRNSLPSVMRIEIVRFIDYRRYIVRKEVLKYLSKELQNSNNLEKRTIYDFLINNPLAIIPYNFRNKYRQEKVIAYTDRQCNLKYVLHDNKRLYFRHDWSISKIQNWYTVLLIDQDKDSPHRYETDNFHVQKDDIVADIGSAEGIFALSIIEKVEKIYLFESDDAWIEALQKTFEPWKDKIVIVNKYIANYTDRNHVTLDEFLINIGGGGGGAIYKS